MYKLIDYLKSIGFNDIKTNNNISDFSSMTSVRQGLIKDDFTIIFGLHEYGKPPTLIYPRPNIVELSHKEINNESKLIIIHRIDDDAMNIILSEYKPEEIYKSILDDKRVFIINSTLN